MLNRATAPLSLNIRLFQDSAKLDLEIIRRLCTALVPSSISEIGKNQPVLDETEISFFAKGSGGDKSPCNCCLSDKSRVNGKNLAEMFNLVDTERKIFREILVDLLRKKFLILKNTDQQVRDFLKGAIGEDPAVTNEKIAQLEQKVSNLETSFAASESRVAALVEENVSLGKKLERANAEIKRLVLEDQKPTRNMLENSSGSLSIMLESFSKNKRTLDSKTELTSTGQKQRRENLLTSAKEILQQKVTKSSMKNSSILDKRPDSRTKLKSESKPSSVSKKLLMAETKRQGHA